LTFLNTSTTTHRIQWAPLDEGSACHKDLYLTTHFTHQTIFHYSSTHSEYRQLYTRWFRYDRDCLCVNKSQFVPVIFEPPCIFAYMKFITCFCPCKKIRTYKE
jgi:hypothetical protein